MRVSLNTEQAKGLADFFFDVAKGLILGGFGLAVVLPLEVKLIIIMLSSVFALACLKAALFLLEGFR